MFYSAQIRKLLAAVLLFLSSSILHSCTKSSVGKTAVSEQNVYEHPETVTFTAENYAFMLRTTYNNFTLTPPQSDMDSITNASDNDAAKVAYEAAIDKFVDDGGMQTKLRTIARQMLGMVNDDRKEGTRYPENLFSYVITEGLPMSEFLLAQYRIQDDGSKSTFVYLNQAGDPIGPPVSEQAGYITYEEYLVLYLNTFAFKMDREIIGINLCDVAPYSKFDSFAWTIDQVNETYRVADDGTSCFSCHAKKEPLRGAWHYFNPNNRAYDPSLNGAQAKDQYGQEAIDAGGATLEPRNPNDTPMAEATAEATMYKFKEGGANILTPLTLAQEIVKEPRFGRCWTERFLAIFLNLDQGHPGQGFIPPNNFSANDAQIGFLDKWTETFNEENQIPKEWIRKFLKDPDYLILSYSPNGNS